MAKLTPVETNEQITGYYFDCPGCQSGHHVAVKPHKAANGASWDFNGNLDSPTFQPSILATWDRTNKSSIVCHSFVVDGKIRFLSDCTHSLAGQIADLPEVN